MNKEEMEFIRSVFLAILPEEYKRATDEKWFRNDQCGDSWVEEVVASAYFRSKEMTEFFYNLQDQLAKQEKEKTNE